MQASNPRTLRVIDEEDEHIGDALQTVFPMWTEDAYMVWNGVHVPISYKYTLSFLIQDAVVMLERLSHDELGELEIRWPSDDFAATWHLTWEAERLEIRTKWEPNAVVGGTEGLLNARPTVHIAKQSFISEWKEVLGVALRALTDAGYTEAHLADLAKLRRVHESIREPGILYREQDASAPEQG
jgi:hypothetical protein